MSDDRVPVRANLWENLNIGTPEEDQPRPFIDGRDLSLVYDLSGFEEQNGVLVRRGQTVTVSGTVDTSEQNQPLDVLPGWDRTNAQQNTILASPGNTGSASTAYGNLDVEVVHSVAIRAVGATGATEQFNLRIEIEDAGGDSEPIFQKVEEATAPSGFEILATYQTKQLGIYDAGAANYFLTAPAGNTNDIEALISYHLNLP